MDKIRIGFEFPNERKIFKEGEEAKPFVLSQEYTLSMGDKSNLRPIVEGIIGARLMDREAFSFEINDLMGYTCMVNVIHKTSKKGVMYAFIHSTAPLPKGFDAPVAFNEPFFLDYESKWDEGRFNSLPDFIKDKMRSSKNFQIMNNPQEAVATDTHVQLENIKDMNFGEEIQYPDEINPDDIPF